MDEISKRVENLSPLKRALYEIEELQNEVKRMQSEKDEKIAVIGMECRFPAADNVNSFWKLLTNGIDAITEVPKSRWDIEDKSVIPELPGKPISHFGGFIDDVDKFDPQFFGISPREAITMDPQQRLLLEVVWHALENSNINPDKLAKSLTGVFIGISNNDYALIQYGKIPFRNIDAYHGSGSAISIAANRISYILDLQGPSISLDTACSSSLVAVHLACQSLKNNESTLAIAGGVSLMLSPAPAITFSIANMLAPNGRCRTFDSSAEGYVRGEGCGVVVLKKLSDAIRDRDNILAVISGTAVNQDGRTNGLTAPNSLAQKMVISEALKKAKAKAEEIGYIEAMGTGTVLGDSIEVQSLAEIMKGREKENPCYIGSVKTNIGHLESAAGMAGLIKTVLMLKNKEIPAHLHFKKANPNIQFDEMPLKVPTQKLLWQTDHSIRKAGVSSFGFGGTNAHIIVEENLDSNVIKNISDSKKEETNFQVLCLSAKNENALKTLAGNYINYINQNPDLSLSEICFSANSFRKSFQYRLSLTAENKVELLLKLSKYLEQKSGDVIRSYEGMPNIKTAFLFPGENSQYSGMGKSLYLTSELFRSLIDRSCEILNPLLHEPLLDVIFDNNGKGNLLNKEIFAGPAIFLIEYSLAKLWISWGVKPNYLMGYGIGELAAAAIANVFSLEDGLKLSFYRSSLINADDFEKRARSIKYSRPEIQLISNATGKLLEPGKIPDASYWAMHFRNSGLSKQGIMTLAELGVNVFLETGPGNSIVETGKKIFENKSGQLFLQSLANGSNEIQYMNAGISELFMRGINVNWSEYYINNIQKKVQLPAYPFQKQRYWFDSLVELPESKLNIEENSKADVSKAIVESTDEIGKFLKSELSRILRVGLSDISATQSVMYLGLDSITAVELKNKVEARFNTEIPVGFLIKGPTLNEIADFVAAQIGISEKNSTEESQAFESKSDKSVHHDFPLSHGQTAMWYQHQLSPGSIFNPTYVVKVKSSIDIEKLRKAINVILKRHPILCTTVHYRDGKLYQKAEENIKEVLSVEFIAGEDNSSILRRVNEEAVKMIDLEKGPLFRVHIFSRSDKEHFLAMISHHIITDMWSQAILLNELSTLYSSDANDDSLTHVSATYNDYIADQNAMLNGPRGDDLWGYWKNKMSGRLPILNISTDKLRPPVQTYKGGTKSVFLGERLTEELHKLSKQNGVTLYVTLLSAFKTLLYRYTGDQDIIVGSPFSGRSNKKYYNTVGYFVNPIPLRTNISGRKRFTDLLADVRQTVTEAIIHQDYPIALLTEKLNPVRESNRSPLFQVMFVFQHAHIMDEEGLSGLALGMDGIKFSFAGLNMESVKVDEQVSPFDITVMMAESENNLALTLTYNTDLFEDSTIERLITHYRNVLCGIVKAPGQLIKEINMLSTTELENIRFLNSQKKIIQNNCIHNLFEKQVQLTPNEIAVFCNGKELTYKELNNVSNRIANYLSKSGIKCEDIIAIDLERGIEMISTMLGVLKAGAAYLPLDYSSPKNRKLMIIKDSKAKMALVKTAGEKIIIKDSAIESISLEDIYKAEGDVAEENPQLTIDSDNLAYVIYTSGSTGKPKGVLVNHKGLINTIISLIDKYDVYKKSRVIQFASPAFDASAQEIYMTLITGGTLFLVDQDMVYSVTKLTTYMEEQNITHVTLPPSLLSIMSEGSLSTLHTIVSAGEACSNEIAKKWSKEHLFINAYGPTEASICSSTYLVKTASEGMSVPIGYPIDNAKMYICDSDMNVMPIGAIGEILIGGKGIARGYLSDPELTAEKFIPDPFSNIYGARLYRTGDLAKLLVDGSMEFAGRKDYQLKIRGNRIEAEEVEKIIKVYPGITDAAIVANKTSDTIYAFYLVAEDSSGQEQLDFNTGLLCYLRQNLPAYMIPSIVTRLNEFPYTVNGKVDRKVLSAYKVKADSTIDQKAKPQTEVEKIIAEIWEEVLNTNNFGIHDNFFDVGGHSLAAAKAQMKLQQKFGSELSIVDLFNYPSIHSLATYITSGKNNTSITEKIQSRVERQKAMVNLQRYKTISKRSF